MTRQFSVRYYCSIDFEHLGQSGRSEIAEDISNNLTKPTIADFSQHEMPAPPCWNPTTPLKNLTPPRWILEPSNQKVAPSNLKTAPSKQETTPSNKKTVPCKKRVAPYQLKYASLKPPPPTKRFKETTEEEIQKLFEARQTNSTKKNTTWGCKMFQDWSFERRGELIDFEKITAKELDGLLEKFYCEARPERTGKLYHKNTLINLRGAINRKLADLRRNMDIVKDTDFKPSNGVLLGLLRERERARTPNDRVKDVITKSDFEKLNTYFENAQNDPILLRHCVYFHLTIHFISRGQEFHEQLKMDSINFNTDHTGEYVTISQEYEGKHYENGKCMYATGTQTCPVKLLKLLMEKTDKSATSLFNKYKLEAVSLPRSTAIWYTDAPLKRRTFSNFMKDMSKAADLSCLYTGHYLRETAIQHLMEEGYEDQHILFMSGFKQMGSLQCYKKKVSTAFKKDMSFSLSKMIDPSVDEQSSSEPLDFSKLPDLPVVVEEDGDDDDEK